MITSDNITVATMAIAESRRTAPINPRIYHQATDRYQRYRCQRAAFDRWVATFQPHFRVIYRLSGVREIDPREHLQVKVQFMPYLVFDHSKEVHPFFDEPFALVVEFSAVKACRDDWVSAYAEIKRYPSQPITMQTPGGHPGMHLRDIVARIAFPEGLRARFHSENAPDFMSIPKLFFRRFHLFFQMTEDVTKRFGVIDQMWDNNNHAHVLDEIPEFDLPVEELQIETPPNRPDLPSLSDFLTETATSFLNSPRSSCRPLRKH